VQISLANKKSAVLLLTNFESLFLVKFKAYTLDQRDHLLVKLSSKTTCDNLDALSAQYALGLSKP